VTVLAGSAAGDGRSGGGAADPGRGAADLLRAGDGGSDGGTGRLRRDGRRRDGRAGA